MIFLQGEFFRHSVEAVFDLEGFFRAMERVLTGILIGCRDDMVTPFDLRLDFAE